MNTFPERKLFLLIDSSTNNNGTQEIKMSGVRLPVNGNDITIKIPERMLNRKRCLRVMFIMYQN